MGSHTKGASLALACPQVPGAKSDPFKLTLVESAVATRLRPLDRQRSEWRKRSHPETNIFPQNSVMPLFGRSDSPQHLLKSLLKSLPKIYFESPVSKVRPFGNLPLLSTHPGITRGQRAPTMTPLRPDGTTGFPFSLSKLKLSNSCALSFRGTLSAGL
jgi:hypothetical protein